jgi:hypothetical protein
MNSLKKSILKVLDFKIKIIVFMNSLKKSILKVYENLGILGDFIRISQNLKSS